MAGLSCHGPPSRFGLTLAFDPEEAISAERMLGALGLMHISRDPDKVMWPIRLDKSRDIEPSIEDIYGLKMDWQEVFMEDSFYQFLIPELLFAQVHQHCSCMFPDNIVVFKGPGRVAKVEISVVPMDTPSILYGLWSQGKELVELRRSNQMLTRQFQLMEHNTAVITESWCQVAFFKKEICTQTPRLHGRPSWKSINFSTLVPSSGEIFEPCPARALSRMT